MIMAFTRQGWMMRSCFLSSLLVVASGVGCSDTAGIRIESSYGPARKFAGLGSSFDWVPGVKDKTGDPGADSPYLRDLIHKMVEGELAAKGFVKRASGQADFWVEYRIGRRVRNQLEGADLEYTEGSLIIYVIDPATRQWMWRSFAEATLQQSRTPEQTQARLEATIKQMLKEFPSKDGQPGNKR